jgi:hypothetical protein
MSSDPSDVLAAMVMGHGSKLICVIEPIPPVSAWQASSAFPRFRCFHTRVQILRWFDTRYWCGSDWKVQILDLEI